MAPRPLNQIGAPSGVSPYPANPKFQPKPVAPVKVSKTGQVKSPVPANNPIAQAESRAGGLSLNKPASTAAGQLSVLPVAKQQQWLVDHGFNVTVDGVDGPQTSMARKAFLNGVAPGYWNKVWEKNHQSARSNSGTAGTQSSSTSAGSSATTTKPVTKPSGTTTRTTAGTAATAPASSLPAIDPNAYAAAAANAEFNPQIQQAQSALQYAQKQLPQSLADLSGWNNQITDMFNKFKPNYGPGVADAANVAGNVSNLFGESTAGAAQAQNDPNAAMLQGLQGSDTSFQNLMQGMLAAQGRDYARRATGEGNNAITKAQQDLSGLQGQKGAARTKYTFDATTQAQNAETARQALEQAKALAPGQQAIQAAQVKSIQADAANAPKLAQIKLATAKAQLAAQQKALAKAGTPGSIDLNNAQHVTGLTSSLMGSVAGPKGGLVLRPDVAWQNIVSLLNSYPQIASDPRAAKIAQGVLTRALNASHGKGQWTAWSLGPNGPYLDKAKAAANAKKAAGK